MNISRRSEELLDLDFMVLCAYENMCMFEVPTIKTLYQLTCGEWFIAASYFLEVNADAYQLTEKCLENLEDELAVYGLDYPSEEEVMHRLDKFQLVYDVENEFRNDALVMVW